MFYTYVRDVCLNKAHSNVFYLEESMRKYIKNNYISYPWDIAKYEGFESIRGIFNFPMAFQWY